MTKQELKMWRQAVWQVVYECPYMDADAVAFFQLWHGCLVDEA